MMGNCWLGSALGNCASHRHDNPSPSEPPSSSLLSPFTSPRSSSLLCLSSHDAVLSSFSFILLCSSRRQAHGTRHHWLRSNQSFYSREPPPYEKFWKWSRQCGNTGTPSFSIIYLPNASTFSPIMCHIFIVASSEVIGVSLDHFVLVSRHCKRTCVSRGHTILPAAAASFTSTPSSWPRCKFFQVLSCLWISSETTG